MYSKKEGGAESKDQGNAVIIEEHITKVNGEVAVKRYRRGEFLGKGEKVLIQVDSQSATRPPTFRTAKSTQSRSSSVHLWIRTVPSRKYSDNLCSCCRKSRSTSRCTTQTSCSSRTALRTAITFTSSSSCALTRVSVKCSSAARNSPIVKPSISCTRFFRQFSTCTDIVLSIATSKWETSLSAVVWNSRLATSAWPQN